MRCFVTGGAGFIGSNMVDRLLGLGHEVVVFDNFSTGRPEFLENAQKSAGCNVIKGDMLDDSCLQKAMKGCDIVFHFAANADVRMGCAHPRKDLEQNTIATFHLLEAMRKNGICKIVFASTGSVYGEASMIPTPEDAPFPVQTSLYAASKIAGEGMITAYCTGFGYTAYIFRFVSILGERYTHGHVFDFYGKLAENPTELYILGNGRQKKSYLYVQDCLDAIFMVLEKSKEQINLYNLGTDEYCTVDDSAGWIAAKMGVSPKRTYAGGERGWAGDNPFIYLDTKKVRRLGWTPKYSIRDGIEKTVDYLRENQWVFAKRSFG